LSHGYKTSIQKTLENSTRHQKFCTYPKTTTQAKLTHSTAIVWSLEVEEISFCQDTAPKDSVATTTTNPLDIFMPPAIHTVTHQTEVEKLHQQVATYQNELKTYTKKFKPMYTMLESLLHKIHDNNQVNFQNSQDTASLSGGTDTSFREKSNNTTMNPPNFEHTHDKEKVYDLKTQITYSRKPSHYKPL
jgi:hypothetical protein